jgi:hypothetical protein
MKLTKYRNTRIIPVPMDWSTGCFDLEYSGLEDDSLDPHTRLCKQGLRIAGFAFRTRVLNGTASFALIRMRPIIGWSLDTEPYWRNVKASQTLHILCMQPMQEGLTFIPHPAHLAAPPQTLSELPIVKVHTTTSDTSSQNPPILCPAFKSFTAILVTLRTMLPRCRVTFWDWPIREVHITRFICSAASAF